MNDLYNTKYANDIDLMQKSGICPITDKQQFNYPNDDKLQPDIDMELLWEDKNTTEIIKECVVSFMRNWADLNRIQQQIIATLIAHPEISRKELCKRINRRYAWTFANLKKLREIPQFRYIAQKNLNRNY